MIFDTHAHFDDEAYDIDREEHLTSVFASGVGRIVNVGASLKGSLASVELAASHAGIYAAVGAHPDGVPELDELGEEEGLKRVKELAGRDKVVAIGEIGLDYHYPDPEPEIQRKWFALQLGLARELNLPVIIHSREAAKDTLDILYASGITAARANKSANTAETVQADNSVNPAGTVQADNSANTAETVQADNFLNPVGVMHCFSYSPEIAAEIIRAGFYIGVGGVVTFNNAKKLIEVVRETPLDRIVLETDCPYLTPVPFRGQRNTSAHLPLVVSKIAEIKGVSEEEVIETTYASACRLYRLKP